MPILFAITVAAFVALLWASISTAQHIRRARRRKQLAEQAERHHSRTHFVADPPPSPVPAVVVSESPAAQPEFVAPPPPPPPAPVATQPEPPAIRFPLSSQRIRVASPEQARIVVEEDKAETVPAAKPAPVTTAFSALAAKPIPAPPTSGVFQLKRPPASAAPEWNPYKEMGGDLSDPAPTRYKERGRR